MPNGNLEDRGQATVTPDPTGNPVSVTVAHTPTEAGEKTFVLVVPAVPGETNTRNNQLERTVLVTDSRRIRVLYVEGYPRYDFRFVKVMLERESDKSLGGKSVEVQVVLLDASKGWAETDRSAFRGEFPTRTELFEFDVVVLGDVDPKQIGGTRTAVVLRDLADFVKVKGGGLLFLSGEHGTPAAYADTPLAEVLPVTPGDTPPATRPARRAADHRGVPPAADGRREAAPAVPVLRRRGRVGPHLGQLQATVLVREGVPPQAADEVLAVHPTRAAEGGAAGELHPLVVQQFAGAGPVLFLGFDETWRWRFRADEEHFDRFWMQAVRVLSRSRVRRPEVRVLPKTEFRRDEKVTVQVRFPIEAPAPAGDAPVRVCRHPVAADRSPTVRPAPARRRRGRSTLTRVKTPAGRSSSRRRSPARSEGEYRFELTDPDVPGSRPSATARVLPPMNERDRTELNPPT